MPLQQLRQQVLMKRDFSQSQLSDLRRIFIYGNYRMPDLRKARGDHESDISCADNGNSHGLAFHDSL